MSLLTPERVPVKVYKWDDVGAPVLDKTAGCMMTIFKACLVTGYGTKESAGWTMPFEDTTSGVNVLRPASNAYTDFYVRLSLDTGSKMSVAMYDAMSDINTGVNLISLPVAFHYAKARVNEKWVMIVSPYGFWFSTASSTKANVDAGYFFWLGALPSIKGDGYCKGLQYSGGTWADGDNIFQMSVEDTGSTMPRTLRGNTVSTAILHSYANGAKNIALFSDNDFATVFLASDAMYRIPGFFLALKPKIRPIFTTLTLPHSAALEIRLGTYTPNPEYVSTFLASGVVATDFWLY